MGTFLQTYVASSVAATSGPAGILATMLAARSGINLPHASNVYEQAAQNIASRVRNYLASIGYGEPGTTCKF